VAWGWDIKAKGRGQKAKIREKVKKEKRYSDYIIN